MFKGALPVPFRLQKYRLRGSASSLTEVSGSASARLLQISNQTGVGHPSTSGARRGRGCCTGICTVTAARSSNAETH